MNQSCKCCIEIFFNYKNQVATSRRVISDLVVGIVINYKTLMSSVNTWHNGDVSEGGEEVPIINHPIPSRVVGKTTTRTIWWDDFSFHTPRKSNINYGTRCLILRSRLDRISSQILK